MAVEHPPEKNRNVFLYVPNLIGYFRLLLLVLAWFLYDNPPLFVLTYLLSITLDGVDGIVARKLGQTSVFGAWLDVAVDNLGRGMLWTLLHRWGYFISALEWLVFIATHNLGGEWKTAPAVPPLWVKSVMANGFKTPIGVFVISGLHILPLWLYYLKEITTLGVYLSYQLQYLVTLTLVSGRILCAAVELWFLLDHIRRLAQH